MSAVDQVPSNVVTPRGRLRRGDIHLRFGAVVDVVREDVHHDIRHDVAGLPVSGTRPPKQFHLDIRHDAVVLHDPPGKPE